MEKKAAEESSNDDENARKGKHSANLDNDSQRGPNLGLDWFPENLRQIVAACISNSKRDPMKSSLLGKQPITLCLSQYAKLDLGVFWNFGCLSPEDGWESAMEVKVDKQYPIEDYKNCLALLSCKNTLYCPIVIEVLVFQLDLSSKDFPRALVDLQNTLTELQQHLSSVQDVVFVIGQSAFFCFSFKDFICIATGLRQPVDRPLALRQILDDFGTCWKTNESLSATILLDFYITSDVKPDSDKYLSNFVISVNQRLNGDFLNALDPSCKPSKLKLIYLLETIGRLNHFDQKIAHRCHAIHWVSAKLRGPPGFLDISRDTIRFQDNPFLERIFVHTDGFNGVMKLPQPSTPLTDTTSFSALVELSLRGLGSELDLTELNKGYFPHLARLSVINGRITGHLDSQRVPCLRTLRIEPKKLRSPILRSACSLIHENTQSLLHAGRPWQLAATNYPGGWSLASYDAPLSITQDDGKEDSPPFPPLSLPLIKELMLVGNHPGTMSELQEQLKGNPYPGAVAENRCSRPLVWAPDRVEKITVFSMWIDLVHLCFKPDIPGQVRILTSLTSHNVGLVVDGAAVPDLQSLKVTRAPVELSGTFLNLKTLSFDRANMVSPWYLNAPMLKTFYCVKLYNGKNLSLRPPSLPHLSSLQITLRKNHSRYCPQVIFQEDKLGLSRVNRVVFGKNMTRSRFFHKCQINYVSHLELTVDAFQLPACWSEKTEWQCETLTINVIALQPDDENPFESPPIVMLPLLPRVKTLTVTEEGCQVSLNALMPELTECTVSSPRRLGPNFKCPALKRIRFTDQLFESDKEQYSNPTTYEAIGARPREVIFAFDYQMHTMTWGVALNENEMLSLEKPLEEDDDFVECDL